MQAGGHFSLATYIKHCQKFQKNPLKVATAVNQGGSYVPTATCGYP